MTDKNEVLRLAALIEKTGARGSLRDQAAVEPRRLYAENETLREKLKFYEDLGDAGSDVQLLRMGYAAARLEIESLKAQLHVGDSAFESWYSSYNPTHKGDKQRARDAYAAGMGDSLVMAGPARQALIDVIAQGLSGTWHCLRVWSAWNVGTMSQDDFSPVDESDTPAELADAVLAMLAAQPAGAQQPAPTPQADRHPAPAVGYPPLPRVGAIGYASVVDIDSYAKTLTIGPHLPGVRDIALWTTDKMRSYVDADRAMRAAQPAGAQQPGAAAWMPLPDTLPDPGKPVLLDIGKKHPIRAMWAAKHTVEAGDDDTDWGEYDEATDTYYCPEGWYEWNQHEETHWAVSETPVAWCELPPSSAKGVAHG